MKVKRKKYSYYMDTQVRFSIEADSREAAEKKALDLVKEAESRGFVVDEADIAPHPLPDKDGFHHVDVDLQYVLVADNDEDAFNRANEAAGLIEDAFVQDIHFQPQTASAAPTKRAEEVAAPGMEV